MHYISTAPVQIFLFFCMYDANDWELTCLLLLQEGKGLYWVSVAPSHLMNLCFFWLLLSTASSITHCLLQVMYNLVWGLPIFPWTWLGSCFTFYYITLFAMSLPCLGIWNNWGDNKRGLFCIKRPRAMTLCSIYNSQPLHVAFYLSWDYTVEEVKLQSCQRAKVSEDIHTSFCL